MAYNRFKLVSLTATLVSGFPWIPQEPVVRGELIKVFVFASFISSLQALVRSDKAFEWSLTGFSDLVQS